MCIRDLSLSCVCACVWACIYAYFDFMAYKTHVFPAALNQWSHSNEHNGARIHCTQANISYIEIMLA